MVWIAVTPVEMTDILDCAGKAERRRRFSLSNQVVRHSKAASRCACRRSPNSPQALRSGCYAWSPI